jgi:ssDNA-specific exonuclease RecJ
MELLKSTLGEIVKFAISDRDAFAKLVREKLSEQQSDDVKKQKKRLAQIKKRSADLEVLLRKIYEDNALGKLPDKRYEEMATAYEKEQSEAEREAAELQSTVDSYIDGNERADRFIKLIERYENFDELTTTALNELVEKIVVHEPTVKVPLRLRKRLTFTCRLSGILNCLSPKLIPPKPPHKKRSGSKKKLRKTAYIRTT